MKRKLVSLAICPNCGRRHYAKGKRVCRRCKCSYYISHVDYTELVFK